MRFAILGVIIVVMLLAVAGGAFVFTYRSASMPMPVQMGPVVQTATSDGDAVQIGGSSGGGVRFSNGSVGAKIWRDGKRVLFEIDGWGVEFELGAEDGTFDFTKLREHFDILDKSFDPDGGALREIVLEVGEGVPGAAVTELARIAKERRMRGVKVDGAFVPTEKND